MSATEVIPFKITTDTTQVEKSVKSIKTELREATQEALNLSRKFGDASKEALQAQQKVANLKDEIGDFKDRVDALNPDAKFTAFSQSLQGVAGGFAGLQGAIGLFGTESKDLEKQLLKVQSALALSEGLNSILQSKDAFKSLGVVGVQAFNSIKTAIGATGIGLLVVALGAIYANWEKIKEAVTGISAAQLELNKQSERNVELQKEKINELDSQDEVLKKQGLSERQILKLKELQTQELIRQQIIQLEGAKIVADAEVKKTTDLYSKTLSAVSSFAGTAAGLSVASLLFDPAETIKKGGDNIKAIEKQLNETKNKLAGYQNQIVDIDKKTADDQKAIREKNSKDAKDKKQKDFDDDLKRRQYEKKVKDDLAQEDRNNEASLVAELTAIDEAETQKKNDRDEAASKNEQATANANAREIKRIDEESIRDKEIKAQAQMDLLKAVGVALGEVSDILGRETAAGKALAIASTLINTYAAIAGQLKAFSGVPIPGYAIVQAVTTGLVGFKAVKNILSTKVPGKGGGGGASAPSSFSASGASAVPQAPIQSGINIQQTALTPNGNSVNVQNQQTIKAYVVERDITDSQDRISKIKAAATI